MTQFILFHIFHTLFLFIFSSYDHDTDNDDSIHSKSEKNARIGRGYDRMHTIQMQT